MRFQSIVVAVAVACACGDVCSQETPTADSNGGRIQYLRKLIEESSAAKQVEASNNETAKARRLEARAIYDQAVAAQQAGDTKKTEDLLNQAAKTMFDAVRMAGANEVLAGKKERDYQDRLASVNSLMEAHDRISSEKGKQSETTELYTLVKSKVTAAESARAQGNIVEARGLLDEAYVAAKIAIESLRGGETLVRSLNFKNKEEEYRYELDRNDTHRMLVIVLLKEKMDVAATAQMVQPFLDNATKIRTEAERQAAQGDHAAAVSTLEQSTKEYVRAIRSAGVYIPG